VDARAPTLDKVEPIERETIRRVFWRLIPLLMLGMFCAYLDRSNIGMAAPTMKPDLGFSNTVFGFGAGLFFLGYFLFEIPSNLILNRLGARRWIARIMITWGIVAAVTAFVWNDQSFYAVRFLLGLAEAGFSPGVIIYLTWWFPSAYRTRAMAAFQSAATISLIVGPPIGGLLLHMDGLLGLHGWQWMLLLEALPAIIMCFVIWNLLTDKPADATWLRPDQKAWLTERLASERSQREAIHKFSLGQAFANPKILLLTFAYIGQTTVGYGVIFFLPLIVRNLGVSADMMGLVSALPYMVAFVAMLAWGWHSDVTGERTWHIAGPFLLAAAGLATCAIIGVGHPVLVFIALMFAILGQQILVPIYWSIPSAILTGTAAAGGIALINSVGNLGGFFGPSLFGLVKDASGSDTIALLSLALAPALSAIMVLMVGHDRRLERIPSRRAQG
jgi:MFS family permease